MRDSALLKGISHVPHAKNLPQKAGALAHNAGDVLKVDKDQHGTEQHYGFLKDPVLVKSLFLKKPERIEALGLVV